MVLFEPHLILYYFGIFFALFIGVFYLITLFDNRQQVSDPKARRLPSVSIIVPAYNEAKTIYQTLTSLQNLDYPKDQVDIIVVDDGSLDRTHEIASGFSGVYVLRKGNGGKGSAINAGLRVATRELVAIMDADSFVTRRVLMAMVGYFDNQQVMAVTPTLKVYHPEGFWQGVQYVEYLFSVFFRKIFSFLQGVYVTPGPFSVYRKSFFDRYGGFDENNITEDLEIALRIQSHSYIIQNSINAEVFTMAPNNFRDLLKQRVRWYTGMMDNLYTYRRLFGARTGYLGVLVLPVALISVALVLAFLSYYGVSLVANIVHSVYQTHLINFDLISVVKNYLSGFSLLQQINPISMLFIVLLGFSVTVLLLAKIYSRDRANIAGGFVMYALTYGPIFSVMWFVTLAYKALQAKIQW